MLFHIMDFIKLLWNIFGFLWQFHEWSTLHPSTSFLFTSFLIACIFVSHQNHFWLSFIQSFVNHWILLTQPCNISLTVFHAPCTSTVVCHWWSICHNQISFRNTQSHMESNVELFNPADKSDVTIIALDTCHVSVPSAWK